MGFDYKNILITGGAGFVGSGLAIKFKRSYPGANIIAFDNLKRRGSELNIARLREAGVVFQHGDVRNKEDLIFNGNIDLILECSAEPSVLAGIGGSPEYLINTNLMGMINCLELARDHGANIIFLSTSRVYPIAELNRLKFRETDSRFELLEEQDIAGASKFGVREDFPLGGACSLYGATKLSAEIFLQEYIETYKIRGIINRCGVIAGPWQMGKVDQGVAVLWMAAHVFGKKLSYIGYGGQGKQVRDLVHIDDLFDALDIQMKDFNKFNAGVYNIGGGLGNSLSLREMTVICENISGNKIAINSVPEDRPNDVRIYISDCSKFRDMTGWSCQKNTMEIFEDIYKWIIEHRIELEQILF